MIPTVLHREEVINILVDDPALFVKLVKDEHADRSEHSKEDLTVKMDAVAELGRLDSLETFEKSFWGEREVDLDPILALTNQLTRTFAVYLGNASTLFDKTFEEFMFKFRQSLDNAGMSIVAFDFTVEDMEEFEKPATSYLSTGEFLQTFIFDRLLSSQIMMKQVVNLPATGFSLRDNIIKRALEDPVLSTSLVKFILRVSYVSQGAWEDLFPTLVKFVYQDNGLCGPAQLIDHIEQDIVFSCNLLCRSYPEIRLWTPIQRRQAIASSLDKYLSAAEST